MKFKKLSLLPYEDLERAASILKTIAHPTRITIISMLEEGKMMTVTEIYKKLKIEQSTTSHHLSMLKDKGVLGSKRVGKNTYYYIKNENLTHIIDCISNCAV